MNIIINQNNLNTKKMENSTKRNDIVINDVDFKSYKHWSYEGNTGIYLQDEVTKVGEIVNGEFQKITFTPDQLKWLTSTQEEKVLSIIL